MRKRRLAAAAALLSACFAANAEHFEYTVDLHGTYSLGGTDGCFPPAFDQPACPRDGYLSAKLSFDTPSSADGSYLIEDSFGDVTDFSVNLGGLPHHSLFGGVNLNNGIPNGSVQAADQSENFSFDWGTRTAAYSYDYGDHNGNGSFFGTMFAVPEPPPAILILAGLTAMIASARRKRLTAATNR